MKSILQKTKECYVCRQIAEEQEYYGPLPSTGLHEHHVFFGTANRKQSEKMGLKVWLCYEHHEGNSGVHHNKELDMRLKQYAQRVYQKTSSDFAERIGKNYL